MTVKEREAREQAAHDALQEAIGWSGNRHDVLERVRPILNAADEAVPVVTQDYHGDTLAAAVKDARKRTVEDVVEALRARDAQHNGSPKCLDVAADFIEREFEGGL